MELDVIYNEDCLSGMQRLPDGSIDMICCDLPYGITNRSKNKQWDVLIPFEPLWHEYERLIKPNGAIVLFASGIFTAQLIMSNPKLYRYSLVWKKGNRSLGFLDANRRPLRCHEDIVVFGKTVPKYNPQKEEGKPYVARSGKPETQVYGGFMSMDTINKDGLRYPKSIIDIGISDNERKEAIHPTQKPVRLIEYLVKTYSDKGDIVLDNCMGGGTTAIACIRTGRHFIGFELNDEFYEKMRIRILNEPVTTIIDL